MTRRPRRPPLPRLGRAEAAQLHLDVQRYLAAIDVFRAEGREPTWRPERPPARRRSGARGPKDAAGRPRRSKR